MKPIENISRLASLGQIAPITTETPKPVLSFPLYDMIFKATQKKSNQSLTKEERDFFLTHLSSIETERDPLGNRVVNYDNYEKIYMLIKIYSLKHGGALHGIPYGGKLLKKGVRFELDGCPTHLQQILYEFLQMHLESQK